MVPEVSAVVVNYNGAAVVDACLSSLLEQSVPVEVVLVDNGSTDGSPDLVRARYPTVRVVEAGRNLGFAGGCNLGVAHATRPFVALVNSDARFDRECLARLTEALAAEDDLAAAQGKVLRADAPEILDSIGSFLTPTGFLHHAGDGRPDGDFPPAYVFSTRAVCMLVRRDRYKALGGFDPDFFVYFEETDFCWRAWLAGSTVKFVPPSVVYHVGGATAGTFARPFIQFHEFKNRLCSILKNAGPATLLFMLPLHLASCLLLVIGALARSQAGIAAAIAHAILWNVRHFRATLRKRRVVQAQIRRVRDRSLFPICLVQQDVGYYWRRMRGALDRLRDAAPA